MNTRNWKVRDALYKYISFAHKLSKVLHETRVSGILLGKYARFVRQFR